MGLTESKPERYLHVMNSSGRVYWMQTIDGWQRLRPDHKLISTALWANKEYKIYNFDRSAHVKSVTVPTDTDQFLYVTARTWCQTPWPIQPKFQRPFFLVAQIPDITAARAREAKAEGATGVAFRVKWDEGATTWTTSTGETVDRILRQLKGLNMGATVVQAQPLGSRVNVPKHKVWNLLDQSRMAKMRHDVLFDLPNRNFRLNPKVTFDMRPNEGMVTDELTEDMKRISDGNFWFASSKIDELRDAVFLRARGKKIKKVLAVKPALDDLANFLSANIDGAVVSLGQLGEAVQQVRRNPFYRLADLSDDSFVRTFGGKTSMCKATAKAFKKKSSCKKRARPKAKAKV